MTEETETPIVEQVLPTPPQALVQTNVDYSRNYSKDEDGLWEQVSLTANSTINQATGVNEITHESWVTLKLTGSCENDCSCKDTELTIHEKTDVIY
ncbi:MAG: hypothetical protein ABI388_03515 [Bacteroidia bacterium]